MWSPICDSNDLVHVRGSEQKGGQLGDECVVAREEGLEEEDEEKERATLAWRTFSMAFCLLAI